MGGVLFLFGYEFLIFDYGLLPVPQENRHIWEGPVWVPTTGPTVVMMTSLQGIFASTSLRSCFASSMQSVQEM